MSRFLALSIVLFMSGCPSRASSTLTRNQSIHSR
jgi:hypothetical protein